jgi:hypothetical protein
MPAHTACEHHRGHNFYCIGVKGLIVPEYCLNNVPLATLPPETLPENGRLLLPIEQIGPRKFLIDYPYRKPDGTPTHAKRTVHGTKIDAAAALVDLSKEVEESSLTSCGPLFSELVNLVLKKNNGGGTPHVYEAIKKRFDGIKVNDSFADEYDDFVEELEDSDKALNTIANYKSAIQTTLRYAEKKRKIPSVPIKDFDIRRTNRDRIWHDEAERERFFNTLITYKSHLYWSMRLLERRPMRSRSDLWRLTDKNLVLVGEGAPYIVYLQKKTGSRTEKETYIPLRGLDDIVQYLTHGRPKGCDLLFPRLEGEIKAVTDYAGLKKCAWYPMGKPRRHYLTMCKEAKISDLHIHDFKHIAMTHMIETEGFSIERIMALGIQFTDKMIKKVYWKKNAIKALSLPESVALSVAPSAAQ